MLRIRDFFKLVIATILLGSCISDAQISDEKRFSMLFNVSNVGNTLTIGEDELYISEFKFALDRLVLNSDTDLIFETGNQITALIFAYNEEFDGNRLIIEVGLGVNDDLGFTEYSMFLEPVATRTNVFDEDFFGETNNYSVIIKGTVNGNEFVFKSSQDFDKTFTFNTVRLDNETETIVLTKKLDAALVFTNNEGEFIDPGNSQNNETIVNNIENNLQLTVISENVY